MIIKELEKKLKKEREEELEDQGSDKRERIRARWSCPNKRDELYHTVLKAVVTHRVNDRPDRVEPRAVKKRPKKLVYLNEPRYIARMRLLTGT